jgi:NADPH2:quinone reductase
MKNKRIVINQYGGADQLCLIEEDCPEPKDGEVRLRVLTAGVCLPDIMARAGIHPETPKVPFTPGWDLVGIADKVGKGVTGIEPGQKFVSMPIHGAYTEFICLPQNELVPVPPGLDDAETVSLVLNYITAYQMMHYSAKVKKGQRILIHGAAGGVGTALLQLGRLAELEMYGTCSPKSMAAVSELGGIPIDYRTQDFVKEIKRLTGDGVNVVFDHIGGSHLWQSRNALCRGGKVVGYGLISSIRGKGLSSSNPGQRQRYRGTAVFAMYFFRSRFLPGRKHIIPYSIQTLKRLKPPMFRKDLSYLIELLQQKKIKPLVAKKFPLAEARQSHELLEKGGVVGKMVLEII